MKGNKIFYILFILIIFFPFTACSIKPPQVYNMVPTTYAANVVTIPKVLGVIKVSGQRIQHVIENDADTREVFRRAVATTLESKHLFEKIERVNSDLADYELGITILELRYNIPGGVLGKNIFETRLFVSYKLFHVQTKKTIWQKNILNESVIDSGKHGANAVVVGFESAAKENISQFITNFEKELKSLEL